jgi:thiopeptide-type bacteriocin biosynthesis protein
MRLPAHYQAAYLPFMLADYFFHPSVVLRTPARPLTQPLAEAILRQSLTDDTFMEALLLASPVLHAEALKWYRGELTDARRVARLQGALTRYHRRMQSRCTPFGLFAGCSLAEWGHPAGVLLDPGANVRHTRLDMHYLCALAQHLATHPVVRPRLRYRPNSSSYQLGGEVRYVEQIYIEGGLVRQLSAVKTLPALTHLLAHCTEGLPYAALVELLATASLAEVEVTEEAESEATLPAPAATIGAAEVKATEPAGAAETEAFDPAVDFLEALIEAQLLVSELEPTVTGPDFLTHIRQVLAGLHAADPHPYLLATGQVLDAIAAHLTLLDQRPANTLSDYQHLEALLHPLGVPLEAGKVVQVDALPGVAPGARVETQWQKPLRAALEALACLMPATPNPRLEAFKQQFQLRYEEEEVPLLEALDVESGLAYSAYGKSSYSPLTHDLLLPAPPELPPAPERAAVHQFMQQKLRAAERQGQYVVTLTADELLPFKNEVPALPPSLGVLFRPVGHGLLQLDSAGGSSAVNLLGRFAHAAPGIERVVREVTQMEQAHNPAVVFAELSHLPASRVGNILCRPALRELEITYLAQSTRPAAERVRAQDLTLVLRQGQLELRLRTTGQRVVPRLSTAHNYTHEALPVYELLCDLQTQGMQAQLTFAWPASDAQFLPRLTYGTVILTPASWQLQASDIQQLLAAASPADTAAHLLALRQQWKLPRYFTLVDGDNELLVDATNPLLVKAWLEAVRARLSFTLREFLFEEADSLVYDAQRQPYLAQCVALLVRQTPCYAPVPAVPRPPAQPVTRDFALGSEWLYYKLYGGPQLANRMLRECLAPLLAELRAAGLIDYWFFVRYADPSPHLRLRLHLPHPQQLGQVLTRAYPYFDYCRQQGYLWTQQTHTYRRELERYGAGTITLTEQLFAQQSTAYLQELTSSIPPEGSASWVWGLRALDELLGAFGYTLPQKVALLHDLREAFTREFGFTKALRLQLDVKFRAIRPELEAALAQSVVPAEVQVLAHAIGQQLATQAEANPSLPHLLRSYAHMLLNRVLPAEPRQHELVLYHFLYRYYLSQQARQAVVAVP